MGSLFCSLTPTHHQVRDELSSQLASAVQYPALHSCFGSDVLNSFFLKGRTPCSEIFNELSTQLLSGFCVLNKQYG